MARPEVTNARRLLIKLSGDAFNGESESALCEQKAIGIASGLKKLVNSGRCVGVVVGGGNILRGAKAMCESIPRVSLDQMGMLATLLNAKLLEQALIGIGVPAVLHSSIDCPLLIKRTLWEEVLHAYESQKIVIFAGGTGNPFFSTDSAAALRGAEMGAEILLKATQVDGVYSDDPHVNPAAERYDVLSWTEALQRNLKFMDATAIALCREVNLPILVFNKAVIKKGEWLKVLEGSVVSTYIGKE
ncbi:MAG: UMP kinase [Chlamydiia bacterium]|nr:UMP kinase [Chlamydiia bacterium]